MKKGNYIYGDSRNLHKDDIILRTLQMGAQKMCDEVISEYRQVYIIETLDRRWHEINERSQNYWYLKFGLEKKVVPSFHNRKHAIALRSFT